MRLGELDRQEVLLLAHPEAKALLAVAKSATLPKTNPSWERFIKNTALLARYHVTKRELEVLKCVSFLGTRLKSKELLTILMLIRDLPA